MLQGKAVQGSSRVSGDAGEEVLAFRTVDVSDSEKGRFRPKPAPRSKGCGITFAWQEDAASYLTRPGMTVNQEACSVESPELLEKHRAVAELESIVMDKDDDSA